MLKAQGNLPEALKAYRDSLAIAERLAKADPGNAGWQRDLSVSYNKVGDVLKDQGNLPEALNAYRDSLAIAERLAKADPGNAQWQVDVAFAYWRLASFGEKPAETGKRLSTFCNGWTARAGSRRSIRYGSKRPRHSLRRCESDLGEHRRPGQAKREPGSQKGRRSVRYDPE